MKAVADRVWIEKVEVKSTTQGGFEIQGFRQEPQVGIIAAAGPDCAVAKVGEKAIFAKGAGTNTVYENKEYIIMREADLFATE